MKTLFFGTPELAVPFLSFLVENTQVVGVVTRADKPADRGHEFQAPPTKIFAASKNIPVFQPQKWDDTLLAQLSALGADLAVVVAYGRIIPPQVFNIPRHETLNVHFSLLPQYRGAAPIQWALIKRESRTGVTLFWIDEGMDTGPLLLQKEVEIPAGTDAIGLKKLLIPLGVQALSESLDLIRQGNAPRAHQTGIPSFAPPLRKEQGRIDWKRPAAEIEGLIRGLVEWPGAGSRFSAGSLAGQTLKILKAEASEVFPAEAGACPPAAAPGEIVGIARGKGFVIKCSQGFLLPTFVQVQGRKPMPAWDFWQGARLNVGDRLGD
jgi:methionyl-tRNA formyltransferase